LLTHKQGSLKTDIGFAVDRVRRTMNRKSLFILVSDFLDDRYEKSLKRLSMRHEVILIRLFNPAEVISGGFGTVPVVDAESGNMVWINTGDGGYRQAMNQRFEEIGSNLQALSKRHRIDMLTLDTSGDYVMQLEKFFRRRNSRRAKA